ncbi:pilus assembly protein [Vibrio sp. Of7-15]|uniref:TadE/TadG family type IV pilus assembly protein n=1 Tax=Vibrio sp. Of7-15 TaxID=2724879 RepID=UPI001EF2939A|nr:TadE family protein [Vibrio sp. Of7-15]MCG7496167.1 pilus assembly protein [Vibrio sp. Of7-15]
MRSRQRGGQTIEFALTLLPFMCMFIIFIEICRFLLVNSLLDSALAKSTFEQTSTTVNDDIAVSIKENIDANNWPLIQMDKLKIEGRYFSDFNELVDDNSVTSHTNQPYAQYKLTYTMEFMGISFLPVLFDGEHTFTKTIYVAHYYA